MASYRIVKNIVLKKKKGSWENFSHERWVYESIDDKNLS